MRPYYEADGVTIFHADCREVLPLVEVDACITDPPYGEVTHAGARTGANGGEVLVDFSPITADVLREALALLRVRRWDGGGHHAVWTIPKTEGDHPTQKPTRLLRDFVGLFTDPGKVVVDPFMGSGTTLRVCKDMGRRAIGCEIDERYCEIAAKRLSQRVLDLQPSEASA